MIKTSPWTLSFLGISKILFNEMCLSSSVVRWRPMSCYHDASSPIFFWHLPYLAQPRFPQSNHGEASLWPVRVTCSYHSESTNLGICPLIFLHWHGTSAKPYCINWEIGGNIWVSHSLIWMCTVIPVRLLAGGRRACLTCYSWVYSQDLAKCLHHKQHQYIHVEWFFKNIIRNYQSSVKGTAIFISIWR